MLSWSSKFNAETLTYGKKINNIIHKREEEDKVGTRRETKEQ